MQVFEYVGEVRHSCVTLLLYFQPQIVVPIDHVLITKTLTLHAPEVMPVLPAIRCPCLKMTNMAYNLKILVCVQIGIPLTSAIQAMVSLLCQIIATFAFASYYSSFGHKA